MARITSLKAGKSNRRISVSLDGRYSFSLEAEVALKEQLKEGQELSQDYVDTLRQLDGLKRCYDSSARLLGYRQRSQSELKERLSKRGFDGETIEATLSKLREQGLVDDGAFARYWVGNRSKFGPRSRWLIGQELKQKGVNGQVIEQATDSIDEADNAYRAASAKLKRLATDDFREFYRRVGQFLRRRGFSYGIIKETISRLWQETGRERDDS